MRMQTVCFTLLLAKGFVCGQKKAKVDAYVMLVIPYNLARQVTNHIIVFLNILSSVGKVKLSNVKVTSTFFRDCVNVLMTVSTFTIQLI